MTHDETRLAQARARADQSYARSNEILERRITIAIELLQKHPEVDAWAMLGAALAENLPGVPCREAAAEQIATAVIAIAKTRLAERASKPTGN